MSLSALGCWSSVGCSVSGCPTIGPPRPPASRRWGTRWIGERERASLVRGRERRTVLVFGVAIIGCRDDEDAALEVGCGLYRVGGEGAGACSGPIWVGAGMRIFGRACNRIGRSRGWRC